MNPMNGQNPNQPPLQAPGQSPVGPLRPPGQPPVPPPMQPVTSTHIAAAGHDPVTKTLAIGFHNGDVYAYGGVPPGTYVSLLAAKSIGQFFNAKIRGQYPARKLHDHRQTK